MIAYTKQELIWIRGLAESEIEKWRDIPFSLAELRRDNMHHLLQKTNGMIQKEIAKEKKRMQQGRSR